MTHFIPNIFQQHGQDASFSTNQTYLEFITEPELMFALNFKKAPLRASSIEAENGIENMKT